MHSSVGEEMQPAAGMCFPASRFRAEAQQPFTDASPSVPGAFALYGSGVCPALMASSANCCRSWRNHASDPCPWPLAAAVALSAVTAVTPQAAAAPPEEERSAGNQGCCDIAVTDQARDRILVLDANKEVWETGGNSRTVKWSWRPTAEEGFDGLLDNWGLPDEARLRHFDGKRYLL